MRLFLLLFSAFCFIAPSAVSQDREEPRSVFGKIVDEKTNKGIEAASIQLFSVTKGMDSTAPIQKLVGGMLTQRNGDFKIENLVRADNYKVVISAIGYATVERTFSFGSKGGRDDDDDAPSGMDLGNIKLKLASGELETVVVTAQKRALEMGVDRRVFNVDKSLVAAGGTAIDVMKNIPSVKVGVDGSVELRGSSPQIFVDGLPTVLTLEQIPADNIERVELITNPSAKYDASSSGGIINVVLKKNKRAGFNGIASIGAGIPEVLNGSLTLNVRQGRFNIFGTGNYNQTGGIANTESYRENKSNGIIEDYFNQYSSTERSRRFYSTRFGMDFLMDNRNTFTISQNLVKGRFKYNEDQDQYFYDLADSLTRTGKRLADGESEFRQSNTELTYRHQFPTPGSELTIRSNYNRGKREEASLINNDYFKPDGSADGNSNMVRNSGNTDSWQFTAQADYIKPFSEDGKIETGLRTFMNDFESVFDAYSVSGGGETKLPLSNHYRYKEKVYAGYFTYSNKWNDIRYQLGLRAEYSNFDGLLVDSAFSFGYEYPNGWDNVFNGLFPSVYITKELDESNDLQFNYSRRIRRPNFWQLNPFVDIQDPFNIRVGNPALKPEFINNFEVNYDTRFKTGSVMISLFMSNNPDDIIQYSDTITEEQYERLNNAAIDPNAIVNTFINGDVTNRYGVELIWQQKIGDHFEITPTGEVIYRTVKATVKGGSLNNEGISWEGKLILNYQTGASTRRWLQNINVQLIGEYESQEVTAQGRTLPEYAVDFAIRKDFWSDKRASLTFAITDLFNTLRFGSIYDTDEFYQESFRRWNVRSFRLTFSYKFGKSDFRLFKREEGNGEEPRVQSVKD